MLAAFVVAVADVCHAVVSLVAPLLTTVASLLPGAAASRNAFFQGKVVWVTGASDGIGAAVARAASQRGARVILSARRGFELGRVAVECPDSKVLVMDLTDTASLKSKAIEAAELFAMPVDMLIHCAGVSSRSSARDTVLGVDRQVLEVNFFGPIELTRRVTEHMRTANRQGHIAIVSSVQGKLALPFRTSYCASKHAVQGYFTALRAELASSGIGVTIVNPGYKDKRVLFLGDVACWFNFSIVHAHRQEAGTGAAVFKTPTRPAKQVVARH
eukprot:m.163316 g.163316  ORF g.163316 m.163316 type:complete len:272 (+) comp17686_c0_seq6:1465-2280(+)